MSLPVLPPVVEAGGPRNYNSNYFFHWNDVALDLVRITHTIGGFQNGPPLTARFLGIFHLAMHDAYFDVFPYNPSSPTGFTGVFGPYLSATALDAKRPSSLPRTGRTAAEAKEAVAGAAIAVLEKLFKTPDKREAGVSLRAAATLSDFVDSSARAYRQANGISPRSPAYVYGAEVARLVLTQLEIKAGEAGVDGSNYTPDSNQPYKFDDDPSHPIRLRPMNPDDPENGNKVTRPYHGPRYADTAAIFATTEDIKIADPPLGLQDPLAPVGTLTLNQEKYFESVEDVHRMGGVEELATTKRRPAQTTGGLFWAYDGVSLIGTPPRLYNQIIKQIAYDNKVPGDLTSDENNAQIIRVLTLANVAMADAGTFCWREKYKYELWRPLSGVRADPTGPVPDGHGRPTWRTLGAPPTNSNEGGFKPPFPAYPSGHATFGAAAFQIVRLFYDQRGDMKLVQTNRSKGDTDQSSQLEQGEQQTPIKEPDVDPHKATDPISFTFISDEMNGISRSLYQPYNPSLPIESQPGDVRTRVPVTFKSLKEAIFSNGISRIWLGVHWHFDAFAGETVCEDYTAGGVGEDVNQPRPDHYQQKFKVERDGSTKYLQVEDMDWFEDASQGPRDGQGKHPVGGVPLGMMIADNIFNNQMLSLNSLTDLGANINVRRP